jgi:hypothetical protein
MKSKMNGSSNINKQINNIMQILILFIRDTINKFVSYPFINRNRKMIQKGVIYPIKFSKYLYTITLTTQGDIEKIEFIRVCLSNEI